MAFMRKKPQKPQKSLRERVADRKAGIREKGDPKKEVILRRVRLGASISQGIGLVMLMVTLGLFISSGYEAMNWINVMVYSGLFLVGRAINSFLNLSNILR